MKYQNPEIDHLSMDKEEGSVTLYNPPYITDAEQRFSSSIKVSLGEILRGGAIIEVTNRQQAKIAEFAGACCVLVSDPYRDGIVRMSDPSLIKQIKHVISLPVISRARVGHFVEAQILERIGVDFIDESEVIATADEDHFINKRNFKTPFICGSRNLGDALRRISEGASMVRIQGVLSGSGNINETVKSVRSVMAEIRVLDNMNEDEVFAFCKRIKSPYDLVMQTKQMSRLPVCLFAAGGITTPADAALMMQLGCNGVFVGAEIFNCSEPYNRVKGIVQAVKHFNDPHVLLQCSSGVEYDLAGLGLTEDDGMESFSEQDWHRV